MKRTRWSAKDPKDKRPNKTSRRLGKVVGTTPESPQYRAVVPYLRRIALGEDITCQQIVNEIKTNPEYDFKIYLNLVVTIYSHYLKQM